jgi:ribonuclease BN (tRNA processing enzyme)
MGDKEKHIVYDCGSTKVSLVKKKIENIFKADETIEAVFISHFDDDHINGLKHLLKHCKIRKLFIPFLYEEQKALLLLHLLTRGSSRYSFLYALIANPESVISEETQIVYVTESDDENYHENDNQEYFFLDGDNYINRNKYNSYKIPSGKYCKFHDFDWVYIPYNYKEKERRNELIKLLKICGVPVPSSISEIPELFLKHSKELKRNYKLITEGINTNSMVVYSGPIRSSDPYRCYFNYGYAMMHPYLFHLVFHNVGCLYTGDCDIHDPDKWKALKRSFIKFWDLIGTWQIPHHGARLNYNPAIGDSDACIAVISAGCNNRYGHPHEIVIRDLLLKGKILFVVTEKRDSQVYFLIQQR